MGREWTRTTIGELLESFGGEIKTGPFGTKLKASEYSNSGVPVISVGEVQLGRLVVHERTPKVASDVTNRMPEYLLQEGDIVFGRKGAVERSARVTVEQAGWFLGSDGIRVRLPSFCDSRFVSYLLLSKQHQKWMIQHSAGTTMASLNEKIVRRVPLILPPLNIQRRVAEILGTLDKKIDLNQQMNTTLESMAQALFKSWFVDFDPVIDKALAAGNHIPEPLHARAEARKALGDQCKPLPAAIQHQFPDRFVFIEEMGWVPEGWENGPVSDLADLNPEAWTVKEHPEKVCYVDLSNTKDGRITDTVMYSFSDAPSRARRVLRPNDTIFGTVRPGNRSFAFIQSSGLTGSTGFAVLRPRDSSYKSFIYYALTRKETIDWFAHIADGGAYPAIRPTVVSEHLVIIPAKSILVRFDTIVTSWLESIERNNSENRTLADLRDTLLPKLLSGELRVPEAEATVASTLAEESCN